MTPETLYACFLWARRLKPTCTISPTTDVLHLVGAVRVSSSDSRSAAVPDPCVNTNSHSEKSGSHSSAPNIVQSKNT